MSDYGLQVACPFRGYLDNPAKAQYEPPAPGEDEWTFAEVADDQFDVLARYARYASCCDRAPDFFGVTVRVVPSLVTVPDWLETRYAEERAELERLLTPEMLSQIDAEMAAFDRRMVFGDYLEAT